VSRFSEFGTPGTKTRERQPSKASAAEADPLTAYYGRAEARPSRKPDSSFMLSANFSELSARGIASPDRRSQKSLRPLEKPAGDAVYSLPADSSGWFPYYGIHSIGCAIFTRRGADAPAGAGRRQVRTRKEHTI
jgi:hypothetical protein